MDEDMAMEDILFPSLASEPFDPEPFLYDPEPDEDEEYNYDDDDCKGGDYPVEDDFDPDC